MGEDGEDGPEKVTDIPEDDCEGDECLWAEEDVCCGGLGGRLRGYFAGEDGGDGGDAEAEEVGCCGPF